MAESSIRFSLSGVSVEVRARGTEALCALQSLEEDFSRFEIASEFSSIHVHLSSVRSDVPRVSRAPTIRVNGSRVYGWGANRTCTTDQSICIVRTRGREKKIEIFSESESSLRETAWTVLQSAIGEALDLSGHQRIHGAGLQFRNQTSIVVAAKPGAGKSPLVASCLGNPDWMIFSDESPLITSRPDLGGAWISPFPTRIALRTRDARMLLPEEKARSFARHGYVEKHLFSLPTERIARPSPLNWIIFAGRGEQAPREIGRPQAALRLFPALVVGQGLMQMAQYMVRVDRTQAVAEIAAIRMARLVSLLRSCRFASMGLAADAERNRHRLEEFLQ